VVIPPERLMINGIAMKGGVLDNRLAPLGSRSRSVRSRRLYMDFLNPLCPVV
jgi:hypothetical protein